MGETVEKRVVEAEEFVLKDAEGRTRARLGTAPDEGPVLMLHDAAGTLRALVAVGHDGPQIILADSGGKPLAALSCFENGAVLQLQAAESNASVAIGAMKAEPGVILSDPSKKFTVVVSVSNGALHVSTPEEEAAPVMPFLSHLIQ